MAGEKLVEKSVEADGFTIRYWEEGEGDPVVVLHGAGGPVPSVALDLLSAQNRILLFELPGWGEQPNDRSQSLVRSRRTPSSRRWMRSGSSARMSWARRLVVPIALHLALDHPERVMSMVLESPAAFRVGAAAPEPLARADGEGVPPPPRPRAGVDRAPIPARMGRAWPIVERVLVATPEYDEALTARMAESDVRTLVLFGEFDGVIPPENGRTYRRFMKNSSLQYVHDAAHDIQGDRAEAFADVVGDFLKRGMAFLVPDQDTLINP